VTAPQTRARQTRAPQTRPPRLTIGLPTYNGEQYLPEAIEALLGQSYEDFELIISDNASTDSTPDICRQYEKQDSRVRHLRQPRNIGLAPNHNVLVHEARGELFKWASDDDLYARDLLKRCVDALDEHPEAVLAHSWTAIINDAREVTRAVPYPHATGSPSAPERFCSLLFGVGGDDDGGIIRTDVLRRTPLNGSYYRADRTLVCELALNGAFYHVPEWLYFRRDHPNRAARAFRSVHGWCVNLDPRRASRWRNPAIRLYGEYLWGFISAIQRSPLTPQERRQCYGHLRQWAASRAFTTHRKFVGPTTAPKVPDIRVDALVAGGEAG
jgi:glycosyltransferase involved in cell wall biosynthesis